MLSNPPYNVLFLCTGNSARSMREAELRQKLSAIGRLPDGAGAGA